MVGVDPALSATGKSVALGMGLIENGRKNLKLGNYKIMEAITTRKLKSRSARGRDTGAQAPASVTK